MAQPTQPTRGPIGAHTSASGGVWKALEEGHRIGADTVQLFTANQRRWASKPLADTAVARFKATQQAKQLSHIMSHASYLINLGSPRPEVLAKSRALFASEVLRCQALGIRYLNFHVGAALDDTRTACLDRVVDSLLGHQHLFAADTNDLVLLLETGAGQGSTVGSTFQELAYVIEKTAHVLPVGVCIDTCHIFAAGYDIRTAQDWERVLTRFAEVVGIEYLCAFHLNDSKHELGARKDRHAPLGKGHIGMACFAYLMQSPHTYHLPKYLETPIPDVWPQEIALLKRFTTT